MSSLNNTIITGRLADDPSTRFTAQENPITTFKVLISDPTGKSNKNTSIHVYAHGPLAKTCAEYLKKGRLVAIEGRLSIYPFVSRSGKNSTRTAIDANNIHFLEWPKRDKE